MDLLPPTAPSLVFARETCTPYWMHSLFSQIDVSLNGTLVTPSTNTYAYRAYIETLLSHGAEAKNSQLTSALWYKDTAGHMGAIDDENKGLLKIKGYVVGS